MAATKKPGDGARKPASRSRKPATRAASTSAESPPAYAAGVHGDLAAQAEGIGVYAESGLHASLKLALAGPGSRFEVALDGKVVDLVRESPAGTELVEVQTKRLDKIQAKVLALAAAHRVRVVHPVPAETRIARLSPETGELLSERKSPKRGDLYSVFDELVLAPRLIAARNVTLEVLLVTCHEVRCRDGKGSWRRKGDRVLARDLGEVLESRSFSGAADWLRLIPKGLKAPWTSASLGEALGIGADRARKMLYSYAAAGLIVEAGKEGRRKLYAPAPRGGAAKGGGSKVAAAKDSRAAKAATTTMATKAAKKGKQRT
jgi:hypothetical protein